MQEAIDICWRQYVGNNYKESNIEEFCNKLPGVIKNISAPKLDQEKRRIVNYAAKRFNVKWFYPMNTICKAIRKLDCLEYDIIEVFVHDLGNAIYETNTYKEWEETVAEKTAELLDDWRNANAE